ncbi:zinc finger BED domain-containing protein 1-like, partial [Rhagoletis pomonella]|uniref:zinc finger BED domain-containing protein 1-like n=1 Tax=Rhagoletis pomonella TaxID=28610 RepID=UPI0017870E9C
MEKHLKRTSKENCEAESSKRKREGSIVWQHFEKTNDRTKAICTYCGKILKTAAHTTNLTDHLKRIHPNRLTAEKLPVSTKLDAFLLRDVQYPADSKRKEELDKHVMRVIALDVQPFSIVNDTGFRALMHKMDPRYKLPSKTYLRDVSLPKVYESLKGQLQSALECVEYVAITTDGWTSKANESYLTITCHFINTGFQLNSAVLSTSTLSTSTNHTAANIADSIRVVLTEWGLMGKVVSIVTDNDSTMKKACELLEVKHFPCFAHTVNLLVQDVLKLEILGPILTKCKSIVSFMKRSTTAMAKFKQAQNIESPLGLIQEVSTRWNSAFQIIKRLLETMQALSSVLLCTPKAPVPFSAEEIDILNELTELLSPFQDATIATSGSKNATISLVIPLTRELHQKLQNLRPNLKTAEVVCAFETLSSRLNDRFAHYETRTVPRITTLIDPRFKKDGFKSSSNADQAVKALEQEIYTALPSTSREQPTPPEPSQKPHFSFLQNKIKAKVKSSRADAIIILRQHLENINEPEECDPLSFWK